VVTAFARFQQTVCAGSSALTGCFVKRLSEHAKKTRILAHIEGPRSRAGLSGPRFQQPEAQPGSSWQGLWNASRSTHLRLPATHPFDARERTADAPSQAPFW